MALAMLMLMHSDSRPAACKSVHDLDHRGLQPAAREHLDVRAFCNAFLRARAADVSPLVSHRYYVKAVNCCAEVKELLNSGPDGGDCPPVGPCRGFEGNCADLPEQFADIPVLPDYPNGLADYTCTAFPDDENNQLDSFLVGLIAIAVALPVSSFIAQCFGIANDSEAPETRRVCLSGRACPSWCLDPPRTAAGCTAGPRGRPAASSSGMCGRCRRRSRRRR